MIKLAQNQVWKQGGEYYRIVGLERLEVRFKTVRDFGTGEGAHHHVSKKEFCRLIKGAALLTQEEIRDLWQK
jgi:hypothetical protein